MEAGATAAGAKAEPAAKASDGASKQDDGSDTGKPSAN